MNEVFARFELLEKRIPTLGEIKDLFNDMVGRAQIIEVPSPEDDFYKTFDLFVQTVGEQNQWSDATYTKFDSIKNHFQNFSPKITFAKVDDDYLYSFIKYLGSKESMQLNYKNADKGMHNTTISKNVDFIKWFLRWSAKKKYYNGTSHETFKPKLKGTDGNSKEVIHLSWDELIYLYDFDFMNAIFYKKDDYGKPILDKSTGQHIKWDLPIGSRKAIERVRDVFCFCCFTSLRHSDVFKLKTSDVKKDIIKVVTRKTIDGLIIELNKYSKAILDKYKKQTFRNNKVLPVISLQNMNDHLKIMGQLVGFFEPMRIVYFIGKDRYEEVLPKWALLTTHCGRRTFIVNSLYLGIPAEVVMKWTGHSDYQSMKPYIKIVDELKIREMKKFDNFDVHESGHE
ncbi:MAG: site-specific integrase [Prevotella sp.]|nr:site-specific integrase [Prevotella sp.]